MSLDLLADAYAFVINGGAASAGYAPSSVDITRAELAAWVAGQGAAGRVVTAVSASPTVGMIRAYAFARAGDSTAYETAVVDATTSTLEARARGLAADGYIITAFGRVGDDSAVLVGTRRPGATPRTIVVQTGWRNAPDLGTGEAVVAWIYRPSDPLVILQR